MTRIQLNIFYSRVLHSVFFRQFQECDDVQNVTHIHARPHSHTAYSAYTYIYCTYIRYVRGHIAFQRFASTDTKHYLFCVNGIKNAYSIPTINAHYKAKMMK